VARRRHIHRSDLLAHIEAALKEKLKPFIGETIDEDTLRQNVLKASIDVLAEMPQELHSAATHGIQEWLAVANIMGIANEQTTDDESLPGYSGGSPTAPCGCQGCDLAPYSRRRRRAQHPVQHIAAEHLHSGSEVQGGLQTLGDPTWPEVQ